MHDIETSISNNNLPSPSEIPEDVPEGSDEDTDSQQASYVSTPSNGDRSSSSRARDFAEDIEEYPDDFEEMDSDEECVRYYCFLKGPLCDPGMRFL